MHPPTVDLLEFGKIDLTHFAMQAPHLAARPLKTPSNLAISPLPFG